MEKSFEMPEVQVIEIDDEDIIVTSGCTLGPGGLEIG